MNRVKVIELIHSIENDINLEALNINGTNIWPVLRIFIANSCYKCKLNSSTTSNKTNYLNFIGNLNSLGNLAKGIVMSGWQYTTSTLEPVDAVFLTYSTCRNYLKGYSWYDIFCDPYIEIFQDQNITSLCLELAPEQEYRLPRYKPTFFIQNTINFYTAKGKFLNIFEDDEDKELTHQLAQISNLIKIYSQTNISVSTNIIHLQIKKLFWLANFFEKLLLRLNPSVAFVINYYSLVGMAFNLACHRREILSIDIQHGVQGKYHCAYAPWHNIPENGYDLLPSRFWCWSQVDKNLIQEWAPSTVTYHQAIAGGNLWLNQWKDDNHELVKTYDSLTKSIVEKNVSKKHVLLTLQPIQNPLPDWILHTIKAMSDRTHWWIRLHPGMIRNSKEIKRKLNSHKIDNFEFYQATYLPLYSILRCIDLHVTQWSSTVLEAAEFQVPSVITHPNGENIYGDQIALKVAIVAHDSQELVNCIDHQIQKKTYSSSSLYFCKSSSAIQDIISYIIKCKNR